MNFALLKKSIVFTLLLTPSVLLAQAGDNSETGKQNAEQKMEEGEAKKQDALSDARENADENAEKGFDKAVRENPALSNRLKTMDIGSSPSNRSEALSESLDRTPNEANQGIERAIGAPSDRSLDIESRPAMPDMPVNPGMSGNPSVRGGSDS